MTIGRQTPVRALMIYLARYLGEDRERRKSLRAFVKKRTGAPLDLTVLWRNTTLRKEPRAPQFLLYLGWLRSVGAIVPGPKKASAKKAGALFVLTCEGLFEYTHPELLRAKR